MKKILLTITAFLVTLFAVAQSPNLLNYQGVARNAAGNVLPSQPIGLRLSILSGSPTGTPVYSETRNVTTNAFGLFNVQVGSPGAITSTGTIAGINWTAFGAGSGNKFLQVEIDPIGGTNYFNVGSTQLVSVPYALYAAGAAPVGPAGGDLTGTYPNPQILFPLVKTFSFNASPLIGMTNSSASGTTGAIQGASASTDASAVAIQGTISSTTPGAGSAAVKGVNNGTGISGTGVSGTQAGGGIGVSGTAPNGMGVSGTSTTGMGVNGISTSGIGVAGTSTSAAGVSGISTSGAGVFGTSNTSNAGSFQNTNAANTVSTLVGNGNGSGASVEGTNTGTGRGGFFQVLNPASTADAIRAETNGTGPSWGIHAISSGTNGAGLFRQTNTANTANNLQSLNTGLGRAGLFVTNNAASAANTLEATNVGSGNAFNASTSGTGVAVRINNSNVANTSITTLITNAEATNNAAPNGSLLGVRGAILPGTQFLVSDLLANPLPTAIGGISSAGIGVQGSSVNGFGTAGISNSGFGVAGVSVLPAGTGVGAIALGGGYALQTQGRLQFQGQGAATNRIMGATNATGDATWRTAASLGLVAIPLAGGTLNYVPKFTPDGFTLGNSQVFDNGTNVGIGTIAPQHQLSVGPTTADAQTVMVRGFGSGPANWKGGAAFGNTNASVIMGELNSVAQLGGHNSTLAAWAPLAINSVPGFNVGIGTAAPAYALDVNHNGANGLRVRSLATNSVIDLDAANGDAALRYQNAGITRWNVRNAPGSNDYQILRNNSLPVNVTINNVTGYVGITQAAPSYQLDVLHAGGLSGASGIRSKSSSDFSVVDVDAADGDAALRFQKAGVNQWNIRNRPTDNNFEIFEMGSPGPATGSRVVLQDATGRVGVSTDNPTARMHITGDGSAAFTIPNGYVASPSIIGSKNNAGITDNSGLVGFANGGINQNNGIVGAVGGSAALNFAGGLLADATSAGTNIGIYARAANGATNIAGWFDGRVRINDGTAATGRLFVSTDGQGTGNWQTAAGAGLVSGTGTLNFVPKWTPDGTTLGNSLAFDNGGTHSIGSTTPTVDIFYVSNAGFNTWANINQVGTNVGGVSFTRANVYKYDIAMNAANDFYINNYTSGNRPLTILGLNGNVGINQVNPVATLDVNGSFKLTNGSQAAGRVLTSNATGVATWQDLITTNVGISLRDLTAPQSIPGNAVNTVINTWSTVIYEDGGANFNGVTGEYTITVTGLYEINASVDWSAFTNAATLIGTNIQVNGNTVSTSYANQISAGNFPSTITNNYHVKLTAGDVVRIGAFQNSGAPVNLTFSGRSTRFNVKLLSR